MNRFSDKVYRVIRIVFFAFLMIALRVWHLGVIQHDAKVKEAQKPKTRTILMRANRGQIYDRFGLPLALNRICYNAVIYYSQIAQIPTVSWKSDPQGMRVKTFPRKEHVKALSKLLGSELGLDPERIEDLIHAKASLLPHAPYVIKTHLAEQEFYRLKMLERDWLGLCAEISSERYYPRGKAACHVVGTMGAISSRQYTAIAQEIASLQKAIEAYEQNGEISLPKEYDSIEAVHLRLYELREKSYTLNDLVGKSGVEGEFEEALRGFWGLKTFEVDRQGKALRELPGSKAPIEGKELFLSISAELQEFAEELLIKNEKTRDGKSWGVDPADKVKKMQKQPWIKGGAIVALDPKTGEVLALASYPRFELNDFQGALFSKEKRSRLCRWLENEAYMGALWDGIDCLYRERKGQRLIEESTFVSWDFYLSQILSETNPIRLLFHRADEVGAAVQIQEDAEALDYFAKTHFPKGGDDFFSIEALKHHVDAAIHWKRLEEWLRPIGSKADRLFAIDLCRLVVYSPAFSDELLKEVGGMKLSTYRALNQAFLRFEKKVKEEAIDAFHGKAFALWKEQNQKAYLEEKRGQEKASKSYARPYLDYLDKKEKELFAAFWSDLRCEAIYEALQRPDCGADGQLLQKSLSSLKLSLGKELLKTFRSFEELDRPLLSKHRCKTQKDLAAAHYPRGGFGFNRSFAFQTGSAQGSIFKLVAAYEGLRQGHFLTILDSPEENPKTKSLVVAYSANLTPYPRMYKGGRLPKTSSPPFSKIDLIGAIEHSSNPYFAILAGDYFKNPNDLNEAARLFGFGEKSNIALPGEMGGALPKDLARNRTGLYAYAIGQHTLIATPLQSALMLAALSNGGFLLQPKIALTLTGLSPCFERSSKESNRDKTVYANLLESKPIVRRCIPFSPAIRNPIFEGMDRSIWSGKGSARPSAIKALLADPLLMQEYLSLQHQMIGKTSTAEVVYNFELNPSSAPQVYKHIWFGALSFEAEPLSASKARGWDKPEMAVVVFLRFGDVGREAAPLAAQMIRKWREIKKKRGALAPLDVLNRAPNR